MRSYQAAFIDITLLQTTIPGCSAYWLGSLPFGRDEANLFFNVVARRCGHGSMVPTSNLPFNQRVTALADDQTLAAALLDRLLRHAHIVQISGDTYRLRDKRKAGSLSTPEAP